MFKEAYDRIKNESQELQVFKDFNDRLAGVQLLEVLNKWVDFGLRKELRNAINSGVNILPLVAQEWLENDGGLEEGQEEFYGKIVLRRLKKLIRKI